MRLPKTDYFKKEKNRGKKFFFMYSCGIIMKKSLNVGENSKNTFCTCYFSTLHDMSMVGVVCWILLHVCRCDNTIIVIRFKLD